MNHDFEASWNLPFPGVSSRRGSPSTTASPVRPWEQHLANRHYGQFTLTDAVRPAMTVPVAPEEGYRVEVFRDRVSQLRLPMLTAAVSAEKLFDVFIDLLAPLGETLHVVLESSHDHPGLADDTNAHTDYRRNHIDAPILASYFYDFENLLLNDGCTGVAVLNSRKPMEVQFDEHKIFTIYAADLKPFRRVLRSHGVKSRPDLRVIAEAEHLHHSTPEQADEFQRLCHTMNVTNDPPVRDESWF